MNSYSDNLLNAIEMIAQDKIDKANLNKTIQATVIKVVDSALGKYKIKYQDSYFYAYTINSDISYSDNCSVYVLIPNGDFNQDKFIISAVDKTKVEQQSVLREKDKYEIVGCNCTTQDEIYGVCSYQEDGDTIVLYDKRNNLNLINLNERDVEEYLKTSSYFSFGGDFKTELNSQQQIKGNYGLVAEIVYLDEIGNEVIRKYTLDINSFTSNPYKLKNFTNQVAFFQNFSNMQYISKIYLFCKDFLNAKEKAEKDIFCKNISLCGAIQLEEEEALKIRVSLETPDGNYFTLEDNKNTIKNIKATIKIKNRVSTSDSVDIYWFKENDLIQPSSLKYCYYGGNGWECLNEKQGLDQWIPATDTLAIKKQDIKVKKQKYKCVIVIDNNSYSNTIVLTNYGANLEITLQSDKSPIFFYNTGNCVISCLINNEKIDNDNYKYIWSYQTKDGRTQLEEKSNQLNISAQGLDESVIISCSVYYNDDYLGSSNLSVYNFKTINNLDFSVKIENGDQIYQYSETGLSPAAESLEDPVEIKPFKCSLYNSSGDKLDDKVLDLCQIEWIYPKENTMLKETKSENELSYYIIDNLYNQDNINNTVSVKVTFESNVLIAETNIKILKQGDLGTNGTNYSCKLVPNTTFNNFNEHPMFLNGRLNFQLKEEGKWFNVQLWKDGEKIFEGFDSGKSSEDASVQIKWSVCGNKYNSKVSDMSSFYIDDNGLFNYNDYFYPIGTCNSPVNIIKAEVWYKEKTYFITQPIITARTNFNHSIKLNKDSGFNFVQYNSEGRYPHFKDKYFELELKKQSQIISDYNGFKINWNVLGQVYNIEDNEWKDIILLEEQSDKLNVNQKHFLPTEEYLGECLSVAIQADIRTTAGSLIGQIHIPIHYYLNRQTNSAINGWDGNSIQLDKDGGYILTPQIGAGKKENDNSFTGMIMGRSKNSNSSIEKIGLLGYDKGEQSLFLDAETGSAILGKDRSGQIIIDPVNGKGSLYSHNYWKKYDDKGLPINYQDSNLNQQGMLIDLTNAEIKYGNNRLDIDKDGKISYGEMLSSEGVLTCFSQFLDWSDCGLEDEWTDLIAVEDTMPDIYGNKVTVTEYYPSTLRATQKRGAIFKIFLPENFVVTKALCNLRYYPSGLTNFETGIYYYEAGWTDEEEAAVIPSWTSKDDNGFYQGYGSLRDGFGFYFLPRDTVSYEVEPEGPTYAYGSGFDTSWYKYDINKGILIDQSGPLPNVTEDEQERKETTMWYKTIDFTEKAKQYISSGMNFFAIGAINNIPDIDLTPLTEYTDKDGYKKHRFAFCPQGKKVLIGSYQGNVSGSIILYGFIKVGGE